MNDLHTNSTRQNSHHLPTSSKQTLSHNYINLITNDKRFLMYYVMDEFGRLFQRNHRLLGLLHSYHPFLCIPVRTLQVRVFR